MRNLHLTRNMVLVREGGTIQAIYREGDGLVKRTLPVEQVRAVYAEASVTLKAGAAKLLMKRGIPVHFLGRDGSYLGTLWPREHLLAGEVLVRQAEHYIDPAKRLALASRFVRGATANILRNLRHYRASGIPLDGAISTIEGMHSRIDSAKSVPELMALEGNIRETYYLAWNELMPDEFRYTGRTRRPPRTMLDAMMSFGNSLTYAACLTELYHTQLNPTISYLHEPSERRFSLALDLSEVFKPVLVDRVIFKLVRQERFDESNFDADLDRVVLNDAGKRRFLEAYEERLSMTVEARGTGRRVSHRGLIRLEAYKLLKHLLGMKEYEPVEVGYRMYAVLVYDVADQTRMNRLRTLLRVHMNWVQNSVFEGELSEGELKSIVMGIEGIIDHEVDSVIIYIMRSKDAVERKILGMTKGNTDFII